MDITLEEFEIFAIARLKGMPPNLPFDRPFFALLTSRYDGFDTVLTQIHSLSDRSLPPAQYRDLVSSSVKQNLHLSSNTARNVKLDDERRRDEVGHWVLRLAFCRR